MKKEKKKGKCEWHKCDTQATIEYFKFNKDYLPPNLEFSLSPVPFLGCPKAINIKNCPITL